jgi:uncharacterized damage-inducible protein DinB
MANPPTLLNEALASWGHEREGLVAEVLNVPADRLDFRPAPESRTARELVQHILVVATMMAGELTRETTDFTATSWPKLMSTYGRAARRAKTRAQLVTLLRGQFRDAERRFRAAGELNLFQLMTNFDGSRGTKLAWFHHGVAHEMYHRGQLALYERLLGIEPALTRLIRGG